MRFAVRAGVASARVKNQLRLRVSGAGRESPRTFCSRLDRFGGVTGITVEIRWDRGLANINSVEDGFDARNRAVMLMAGLSF